MSILRMLLAIIVSKHLIRHASVTLRVPPSPTGEGFFRLFFYTNK